MLAQLRSDHGVHASRVRGRRAASGPDRPDRFVRDDDLRVGVWLNLIEHCLQLFDDDTLGVSLLSLSERLANAEHRYQAKFRRDHGLSRALCIGLAEHVSTLRVADESELCARVTRHWRRILTGEGALFLRVNVLNAEQYVGSVGTCITNCRERERGRKQCDSAILVRREETEKCRDVSTGLGGPVLTSRHFSVSSRLTRIALSHCFRPRSRSRQFVMHVPTEPTYCSAFRTFTLRKRAPSPVRIRRQWRVTRAHNSLSSATRSVDTCSARPMQSARERP